MLVTSKDMTEGHYSCLMHHSTSNKILTVYSNRPLKIKLTGVFLPIRSNANKYSSSVPHWISLCFSSFTRSSWLSLTAPYLYQLIVDFGVEKKDVWVIISMMVLCNDIVITQHDTRRPGLPKSPVVMEHDNNMTQTWPIFTYKSPAIWSIQITSSDPSVARVIPHWASNSSSSSIRLPASSRSISRCWMMYLLCYY